MLLARRLNLFHLSSLDLWVVDLDLFLNPDPCSSKVLNLVGGSARDREPGNFLPLPPMSREQKVISYQLREPSWKRIVFD